MSNGLYLLETIRAAAPDSIALRDAAGTLSYAQLNQRADHLALQLTSLGAGDGHPVAICLNRSFDQIIALLAIMRAGAAFVPIDPTWPVERMQHIVTDSGAAVFIAPPSLSARMRSTATPLDISAPRVIDSATPSEHGSLSLEMGELAYIIYTSGSTGVPKGVEITHANLHHLIDWHNETFAVMAKDHAAHVAGLGFDAAVWEIWPYLAAGASISLVDEMTRIDSTLLQRWFVESGITIAFVPTPVAEPMVAMEWPADTKLRILLTGGDTLHTVPRPGLPFKLVNNYGPTECAVVATSGDISTGTAGLPSIGKAIKGTTIYLLDEQRQPVAAGEVGEMYIGGGNVGRGYRNLPEQTAKSFLADPFSATLNARMYKTGDMAKRLSDGQIAFLGRQDNQEKIRGNRIELDEIVSVLNRHQAIAFNVVVPSADTGVEKHLIAYVLPVEGGSPTVNELQEFVAQSLPTYMIPSKFVKLLALPLSANGKVDRSALPAPSPQNALPESGSRAPNSDIEEALLTIVRGLLKTDDIGVEDDFFLVGGHSLLGTQLVLRARETFGVMLTLRDLFEAGTVEGLAIRIEELIMEEVNAMSEEEAVRMSAENLA